MYSFISLLKCALVCVSCLKGRWKSHYVDCVCACCTLYCYRYGNFSSNCHAI